VIAHGQVLKGKVVDAATGEPLVGAVVGELATGNGAATDFDGRFELQLSGLPTTLNVRLVGYITTEQTVESASQLLVVKLPVNEELL